MREKLEKPGDSESKARHLLCAGWQLPDAVYRCAGGGLVQAPEDWHVRGAKPSGVTAGLGARRRPPYAQAGGEEPTHGTNDQIPSHPVHALYVRSHVDLPFRPHRKGCDGGARSIRVSSDADVKAPARFPILLDATGGRVSIAATTGS